MNVKRNIQQLFRGWVPKEPTLHTHQTSADTQNSLMARWMARAVVVGSVASGLLGVFGAQTGLDHGVSGYAWSAFLIAIAPVSVAVAAVFAKRKEAQQRRTKT
ncbi:MAG: hypothetical protein ACQCN4_02840 [Candidatus Bathyarchaeia archaeon]